MNSNLPETLEPQTQKITIKDLILQARQIIDVLTENEGEIDANLDAFINNHELTLARKADSIAYCLDEMELQVANLKTREDEFKEARKALEKAIVRFEDRVKYFLRATQKESIKGDIYTLGLRKTAGRVVIEDMDALPAEYKTEKITIDADKTKIKNTLNLGLPVPGARLDVEPSLKKSINK